MLPVGIVKKQHKVVWGGSKRGMAALQALQAAGLEKHTDPEGYGALDKTRVGVLVGSGMGGLSGESVAGWLDGQQAGSHSNACIHVLPLQYCLLCFLDEGFGVTEYTDVASMLTSSWPVTVLLCSFARLCSVSRRREGSRISS